MNTIYLRNYEDSLEFEYFAKFGDKDISKGKGSSKFIPVSGFNNGPSEAKRSKKRKNRK